MGPDSNICDEPRLRQRRPRGDALDLRFFGLAEAVDSQLMAQVQRYTVAKLKGCIPPLGDEQ